MLKSEKSPADLVSFEPEQFDRMVCVNGHWNRLKGEQTGGKKLVLWTWMTPSLSHERKERLVMGRGGRSVNEMGNRCSEKTRCSRRKKSVFMQGGKGLEGKGNYVFM